MNIKPNCYDFFMLKRWEFAPMLGLTNMSGTWDLGPHVK